MNIEQRITDWCNTKDHWISADGRVSPDTAAAILDRSPATLRNWRSAGEGPPFYSGARVTYRISDLAEWLEQFRCTPSP